MIKSLTLKNVTVFTNKVIFLKYGVNIIHGDNRKGKTTLRQAVSYLLSGECTGRTPYSLRRIDSKGESFVAATLEYDGVEFNILRHLPSKKQKNKQHDLLINNNNQQLEPLDIPKSAIKFLTDVSLFFKLKPQEQRQCLAIFMHEILPYKNLEIINMINSKIPGIINVSKITSFLQVYKKLLDEYSATIKKIETLEQQKLLLLEEYHNLKNESIQYSSFEEQIETLKQQLKEKVPYPSEYDQQLESLALEINKLKCSSFYSPLIEEKNKLSLEVGNMLYLISHYKNAMSICPIFKNVECKSLDLITSYIQSLETEYKNKKAELDTLTEQIKNESDLYNTETQIKIKQLEEQYEQIKNVKLEAFHTVDLLNKDINDHNMIIYKQIDELKEKLKLKDKLLTLEKEIDKIDNRITQTRERFNVLVNTIREVESINDIALVDINNDSGMQFMPLVNRYGKHFDLCFRYEPIGENCIYINGKPYSTLSASEQLLSSVCFQLAFAKLSKLNIIFIDDIELIEKSTAESLVRFLMCTDIQSIILTHTYGKHVFNKEVADYVNNVNI